MAGIAAARALQAAGVTVKLLEGRDRIGGRTYTDYSLGASIDLGAAWIHGPVGNPLTPLAEQFGVRGALTDFTNQRLNNVLAFDSDGRKLDPVAYVRGSNQYLGASAHARASILYQPPPPECRSLADLYAYGLPGIDLASMSRDERLGYHYAAVIRPQYEDAADLSLIDWRLSQDYFHLPGGDLLLSSGGYSQLIQGMAKELDIVQETAVTAIDYQATPIQLQTSRGDFSADYVIVTVPLAILQQERIAFSPPLPAAKQLAIKRMGMGQYEKIALKFPRVFWPLEPQRINYLGREETPLFTAWLNNAHYSGEPILIAYHSGSRAQTVNQLSDEALIAGCLRTLRIMFDSPVMEPVDYVRTNWERDPFSGGSYSFSKVGSEASDRIILGAPVDDRLFFAGEAAHPRYFGTVHAAYETGIHAAQGILATL
jgi:polyamine oxidase